MQDESRHGLSVTRLRFLSWYGKRIADASSERSLGEGWFAVMLMRQLEPASAGRQPEVAPSKSTDKEFRLGSMPPSPTPQRRLPPTRETPKDGAWFPAAQKIFQKGRIEQTENVTCPGRSAARSAPRTVPLCYGPALARSDALQTRDRQDGSSRRGDPGSAVHRAETVLIERAIGIGALYCIRDTTLAGWGAFGRASAGCGYRRHFHRCGGFRYPQRQDHLWQGPLHPKSSR